MSRSKSPGPNVSCAGPTGFTRRRMIEIGGASLLGLSLPNLLRAQAKSNSFAGGIAPRADACVLVFLDGGPSHLDMWDMKPDAPTEIRGEFKPINSSLPGVVFSEHLPRLARWVHKSTIIRSAHHSVNNAHAAAVYTALTGHDRGDATVAIGAGASDYPAIGSIVSHCRPTDSGVVPYISMPYITAEGAGGPPQPGFFGGWLGRTADPLFMLKNPNDAAFGMPELGLPADVARSRFDHRRRLARDLDKIGEQLTSDRRLRDMDGFQSKAADLLISPETRRAFELDRENPKVRDSYGRNIYGQSVLLARRLIEAGTRLACIAWAPDANATWDTHGNNFHTLKNTLLPQLDAAVPSLLGDLEARGMLERTLVVVMGEFGRSPKVNPAAGRGHWNYCYGLMLVGGGIRQGHIFGSSDKIGGYPNNLPVSPAEIVATIYHCLGVPHDLELRDRFNRPSAVVPWGGPIQGVIS